MVLYLLAYYTVFTNFVTSNYWKLHNKYKKLEKIIVKSYIRLKIAYEKKTDYKVEKERIVSNNDEIIYKKLGKPIY